MAVKPERRVEFREITYSVERWKMLKDYRHKAAQTMSALEAFHLKPIVHGSIARGDVDRKSDIDIFIPNQPSSFIIETALEKARLKFSGRLIVQATPTYALKAFIELDEKTTVSFPMMKMRKVEREFYNYGGECALEDLKRNTRVCGVDKRLMLIEPTETGHNESTIIGREEHVARLLDVSFETVLDRVHALLRRDKVGRTGVFIKKELRQDENFEKALKRLADENPAVRRRLRTIT